MKRMLLPVVVIAALGCDPGPSGNAGAPAQPSPTRESSGGTSSLGAESGSFFWFNSRAISDSGQAHYGRFAYSKLLPLLSPREQKNPQAWFVAQDGDYLGTAAVPASSPEERRLLGEVDRLGRSLCYAIALYGAGGLSAQEMDARLRAQTITGYLGRTTAPGYDAERFLRLGTAVGLPIAFRIDGARLKRIGFDFISDEELQALGFQPYPAR